MTRNRKQNRHDHELGDCHELTCSCYQNKALLTCDLWNQMLCQSIDRNLSARKAVEASIDYIHLNPVQQKQVDQTQDWKWSSARWYVSEGKLVDSDLPEMGGLSCFFKYHQV